MSIHEEIPIEVQQRQNFAKLADWLDDPKTAPTHDFCMLSYDRCALGYARHVVGKSLGEGWRDYGKRAFGVEPGSTMGWVFGGWQQDGTSPKAAAARIRYYLKNGAPNWGDYAQMIALYRNAAGEIRPEYAGVPA